MLGYRATIPEDALELESEVERNVAITLGPIDKLVCIEQPVEDDRFVATVHGQSSSLASGRARASFGADDQRRDECYCA